MRTKEARTMAEPVSMVAMLTMTRASSRRPAWTRKRGRARARMKPAVSRP